MCTVIAKEVNEEQTDDFKLLAVHERSRDLTVKLTMIRCMDGYLFSCERSMLASLMRSSSNKDEDEEEEGCFCLMRFASGQI